jgi:hypothetical protein
MLGYLKGRLRASYLGYLKGDLRASY